MTSILTKSVRSWASAMAVVAPTRPTAMPQTRSVRPTVSPAQNSAYPVKTKMEKRRGTGKVVGGRVVRDVLELCPKDDGDNKPVDGDGLTKQNADQVLARNPRRRDRRPDQRRAGGPDSPSNKRAKHAVYHAAPRTENPKAAAMPRHAHTYGDSVVWSHFVRNVSTSSFNSVVVSSLHSLTRTRVET